MLDSLTCGFHNPLQDNDNFELLGLHGPLGEFVKRTFGVDHVANGERRHEEELVGPGAKAHVQLELIQRQELAFGRLPRLKKREERKDRSA